MYGITAQYGESGAAPNWRALTLDGRYVSIAAIFELDLPAYAGVDALRRNTAHGRCPGSAERRLPRRQVRPRQGARLHHRDAGGDPDAADAAGARPPRGAQH